MEITVQLKKLIPLALASILSLAIVIPAFAQSGENKDFQSIQDERDQRKSKQLIEDFITKYPNSAHRPELDLTLMGLYYANKDWAQMVKAADGFAQTQGSAEAKAKSNLFTLAMEGARQLGNQTKFNEFADRALTADPNNISVLMTMSRTLSDNPPNDATARNAAMDKALGYAQRAQKISKPVATTDAEWLALQARLHGTLGVIYFTKSNWADAGKEFTEYVKANPTDGLGQYRLGLVNYNLLQTTLATLQSLNTEARAAQTAGADDLKMNFYSDKLTELSKEFETRRDVTIDAMARAIVLGGSFASQAQTIIEPLFKQKTNSLDGLPAFIAAKKTELAALMPVAPPVAPPQAGGRGGAPAGGGAGGGRGGK